MVAGFCEHGDELSCSRATDLTIISSTRKQTVFVLITKYERIWCHVPSVLKISALYWTAIFILTSMLSAWWFKNIGFDSVNYIFLLHAWEPLGFIENPRSFQDCVSSVAWNSVTNTDISKLKRIQRKFGGLCYSRFLNGVCHCKYEDISIRIHSLTLKLKMGHQIPPSFY